MEFPWTLAFEPWSFPQFFLGLGEDLTKRGEVIGADFLALHESGDKGGEAAVEDTVEETAAFLVLAVGLSDGGRVAKFSADGLHGKGSFFGEPADEGLHGAWFPVQSPFQFLHNLSEGAGAAFPKYFHDGPFGIGDARRGGWRVVFFGGHFLDCKRDLMRITDVIVGWQGCF